LVRIVRIWTQTLIPPLITTSLYFLIFGKVLGERLGSMEGKTYMQFIAPGLILMAIINSSYSNVSSSFFSARFSKSIEEMLISPMPRWQIIVGYMCGGIFRGLVVGSIVSIVAFHFAKISIQYYFYSLPLLFFSAAIFSMAGFLNGILAKKFDDVAFIPSFVITPLVYLGGVFYPVSNLPDGWRQVSYLNPIYYLVAGYRDMLLGTNYSPLNSYLNICMLCIFTIALFTVNNYLLKKGRGLLQLG
jgi:ABC-2 type transport system permease protein